MSSTRCIYLWIVLLVCICLGGCVEQSSDKAESRHDDESAAEASYRNAINLEPGCVEAIGNLAGLLWDRDYDEAKKLYKQALELDPEEYAQYANFFEEGGSEKDDT